MAKRKAAARNVLYLGGPKRKSKSKSKQHTRVVYVSGASNLMAGGKRKKRRHSRGFMGLGDPGPGRAGMVGGMMAGIVPALVAGGGAVGAGIVGNFIPVAPKIKPFIPLLIGLFLVAQKNALIKAAGIGMAAGSILGAVKQFAPNVPTLAGEVSDESEAYAGVVSDSEGIELLGQRETMALLGEVQQFSGEVQQFSGATTQFAGEGDESNGGDFKV